MDADGEGSTKWKRLHNAVAAHQNRYRNGKATIALINEAMLPGLRSLAAELAKNDSISVLEGSLSVFPELEARGEVVASLRREHDRTVEGHERLVSGSLCVALR